jgi:SAM-dependent methyltransferase
MQDPQTWHYGLIARYWAEFNDDFRSHEIPYFQRRIEEGGGPALDVGCGTGRLLVPYLRAGLDVDGCDVSADMVALCREKAERERLTPRLWVQPMHELDPPRRYRTIYVCGAFGLGSTRAQDCASLRRFYEALERDGTLFLDIEVPYADEPVWKYWPQEARAGLPQEARPPSRRQRASDGTEYALSARIVELDPLEQRLRYEMHAERWRNDELVEEERRKLHINLYFKNELELLLERAGFDDIVVEGDHNGAAATPDDAFVTFAATRRG